MQAVKKVVFLGRARRSRDGLDGVVVGLGTPSQPMGGGVPSQPLGGQLARGGLALPCHRTVKHDHVTT